MKLVRILIVALGLMTIAATAYAIPPLFISSSTQNEVAPNAQTGLSGNIILAALTSGTVNPNEVFTVAYGGAQISSLTDMVVTIAGVSSAAGAFVAPGYNATATSVPPAVVVNGVTVVVTPTALVFRFPAAGLAFSAAAGDTISIGGVRLNVVPVTGNPTWPALGTTSVAASLFSQQGTIAVTNGSSLPVITIVEPLKVTLPLAGAVTAIGSTTSVVPPIQFSTGGLPQGPWLGAAAGFTGTASADVLLTEGFNNAFEIKGGSTQIWIQVTDVPAGLKAVNAAIDTTSVTNTAAPPGVALQSATVTAAVLNQAAFGAPAVFATQSGTTALVKVSITVQDPTLVETIAVRLDFQATGITVPVAGIGNISATLAPADDATSLANIAAGVNAAASIFTAGSPVDVSTQKLKYAVRYVPQPPLPFISVIQLQTTLLAQFNAWTSSFDTGVSIQNTSGILGIAGQPGPITVNMYPFDTGVAGVKSFVTSATKKPGFGLDANGNLPAGSSWLVLVSDLATAAGFTGSFQGTITFVTNFTHGHGVNYISDKNFAVQAQGYPMLVIPTRGALPEQLGN